MLRHEVQPNLFGGKQSNSVMAFSPVDTHGEPSGIRWHSPSDFISYMPFARRYDDADAYSRIYRVHNYSHGAEGRDADRCSCSREPGCHNSAAF